MSVFIEGKKRRGKRDRRNNSTMRIGNPSIIAPTKREDEPMSGAEDYDSKYAIRRQDHFWPCP